MTETGIRIHAVEAGSLAAELGVKSGDFLLSLNDGFVPRDILEYKEAVSASRVSMTLRDADSGAIRTVEITKDAHSELGLIFESSLFDGITPCKNRCAFCFVHQLPKGLRKSLYVKDDDYRLSFLEGSFITLTNLTEEDFKRIISSRLTPLYISVHSFDSTIRARLMGNARSAEIMTDLRRLANGGIQFHLQLVLVPGINDGTHLISSLERLASLGQSCLSLGVVPVGLTGHRRGLTELKPFTVGEAAEVIEIVHAWQAKFFSLRGKRLVYAADEFYWLAGYPIPPANNYEGFPQFENGIGLTRLFWDSFVSHYQPGEVQGKYLLVSGVSGSRALQQVLLGLPAAVQRLVRIVTVPNSLFGGDVTVTGLLGGQDIIETLYKWQCLGYNSDWTVILPEVIFNCDGVTLDDLTLADIAEATVFPLKTVDQRGVRLAKLLSKPKKIQYQRWLNE